MSRLRNRSRQCRGRGQERTKPLCASTGVRSHPPPSSRTFGREFLKRYRLENMMTPYEETDSLPSASDFLKPGPSFQALDALVAATSDNDAPRRMNQAKARAAGSRDRDLSRRIRRALRWRFAGTASCVVSSRKEPRGIGLAPDEPPGTRVLPRRARRPASSVALSCAGQGAASPLSL